MKSKSILPVLVIALLASCFSCQHRSGKGGAVESIYTVDSVVGQMIDSAWIPNAVAYVYEAGQVKHLRAYGYADIEHQVHCRTDHLFRLASQTKALTVVALMQLYEQGLFDLHDKIEDYLPEFAGSDIEIYHLLTHTSGICSDGKFAKEFDRVGVLAHNSSDTLSLAENVRRMSKLKRKHAPGAAFTYANNTDVLGRLIEVLSHQSYTDYVQTHLLDPLQMNHTFFYLPDSLADKLVMLYEATPDGRLIPYNAQHGIDYYRQGSYPSPSAGLVGTVEDYARFCLMILHDGELDGHRYLQQTTLRLMQMNHVGAMRGDSLGFGFAWDWFADSRKMRWGGMFGTDYVIDPDNDRICIFYTNCYPNRSGHNPKTAFLHAVYGEAFP